MPMVWFDLDIHTRLVEEIYRISKNDLELERRMGTKGHPIDRWINHGAMPGPYYLARLYEQGADIIYILVGERTR